MPQIKTHRSDILRQREIEETITNAGAIGSWLQCLIALAWAFGKRINELLRLQVEDIRSDNQFLYVRFVVSKKKTRKDQATPKPYLKRITLQHPSTQYIIAYQKQIKTGPLFKVSRSMAWWYLKKANKQAWWHLFRESLATEMAEHGATEEMLMHWFDWDRLDTAHSYVKRGIKLTEELSERTW